MQSDPAADFFSFAMGEFTAKFPRDRCYATNHMWARPIGLDDRFLDWTQRTADASSEIRWRFGLSAYAVRLLQDVYFLDWELDPGTTIGKRQMIGAIESKKAESDLYAPIAGTLSAINPAVLEDPALINADPYGVGWLIEITAAVPVEELLSPDRYSEHLESAWEVAQRTIKGQANA
ncbi:glycine cleavage system protein H [Roseiconus nitratireducens]|uniref:Glycine cleavage system protein H n=1 Tax=Roseiconus nitratireducens TaxID=2605748 RepID=A0A5M6D8W1_9BACT|nr:glycine cleavage system protein H [Roseiconus nitratireducens]KAA5543793.1 glycine cleavage system protein H [Roseiconus nitratireducens]